MLASTGKGAGGDVGRVTKILGASLLCLPVPALAEPSASGLTGLGEMRTPDVVSNNETHVTLAPGRYTKMDGNDFVDHRVEPSIGVTQGFGKRFEAGLRVPLLVQESSSELANASIAAKLKIHDWPAFHVAADAGVELPTASGKDHGSGQPGATAGVLASATPWRTLVLAASVSYGTSDYCGRCTLPGSQATEPGMLPVVRGAAGASFGAERLSVFGEVHALKVNNGNTTDGEFRGDPDLYALAGARVRLPMRLSLTAYGGVGLDAEGSNTEAVGSVLLHYRFSGFGAKPASSSAQP